MNTGVSRRDAMPTLADVAFPDGRTGFFGIREASSMRGAVVAFAMTNMSLRPEPVPVLATRPQPVTEPESDSEPVFEPGEPAAPTTEDVVGSIRVADILNLEDAAADDPVANHLGPIPPALIDALPADEALDNLGNHEIALVVNEGDQVIGVVTRGDLVAAIDGDQGADEPSESAVDGWSSRGA